MKRALAIVLFVLLLASPVWAEKSIGNTGDASITTGKGYLTGILVNTDGTNSVTFAIYDNTAASGTKICSNIVFTTSSANRASYVKFDPEECPYHTGIYIDVTTAGTVTYDVFFKVK